MYDPSYVAPRWWGNGEVITITAEPRHRNDSIGRTYDLFFYNITARSENGGLISGIAHGIHNVVLDNVNITIAHWSNYSTGVRCVAAGGVPLPIECMGSHDRRPALRDGDLCGSTCRQPANADGVYFENAHNVTFRRVTVRGYEKGLGWGGGSGREGTRQHAFIRSVRPPALSS